MNAFSMMQGDTLPVLLATLSAADGTPYNLTGATVKFIYRRTGAADFTSRDANIIDALTGQVSYAWVPDDTAIAGDYRGQFEVTNGGSIVTFPNDAYVEWLVRPQIDVTPVGTPLSELLMPVRAIVGDFDPNFRQFSDDAIKAVIRLQVMIGQLSGYSLSADQNNILPALAAPRDWGSILYRTGFTLVAPNTAGYSFRTRALSEKFGDRRVFLQELRQALYEMENPGMLSSFSDFSTWLTGITGLPLFQSMTEMKTMAPVATATISAAGINLSGPI